MSKEVCPECEKEEICVHESKNCRDQSPAHCEGCGWVGKVWETYVRDDSREFVNGKDGCELNIEYRRLRYRLKNDRLKKW